MNERTFAFINALLMFLFVCRKRKLQLPKKLTKREQKKKSREYLILYSLYLFILRIEFVYWFCELGINKMNDAIQIRKLISFSIRQFYLISI